MDKIGDCLTTIRNAYLASHKLVKLDNNRKNRLIVDQLVKHKIFKSSETLDKEINATFADNLNYLVLRRISKPGRKLYAQIPELTRTNKGLGFKIISSSKGVMSDREAVKAKIGGEIICQVIAKFQN